MKNHLIGFIVSAFLHAGLISGVITLNKQPEKNLAPEKVPENKVALMVKMFKSDVSHHSASTVIDDIDIHSDYIVPNHFITPAPLIKKQIIKKGTKKKNIKRKAQKVIRKKTVKNIKRSAPKSVLAPKKRKIVKTNIRRKIKVVKRQVRPPVKPYVKRYAVRKISPQRQHVTTRKVTAPYRNNLHRKTPQKHKPLSKKSVYARAYNNKARGKAAIARKQVRSGSIRPNARVNVRANRKQTVLKRSTSNRLPQYHKKSNPRKTASKNVQRLNQQYKARLHQIIVSKKSYPRRARRHGQQGKVTLSFSVSHSGTITDIRVLNSSGIPVLDKASIKAIQQSSKILRFFPGMPKKSMKLSITLNYILNSG